jgi:2'-5' RNA ligase
MRLFVALAPPAQAVADLNEACAPFRRLRADLRWTSTDAWHITLAFLGEVAEASLERLVPRLERGAQRHGSFGMSFGGAGAFPSAARANVLWSGVSGDRRALAELAQTVAAAARRAGAAPPDAGRRFHPHLTLARCRAPVNVEEVVAGLDGYAGPAWHVGALYLIRSVLPLPPRGASVPLRPPSGGETPLTPPFPGGPGTGHRAPGLPADRAGEDNPPDPRASAPAGLGTDRRDGVPSGPPGYRAGEEPPPPLPPAGPGATPRYETLGVFRLRTD